MTTRNSVTVEFASDRPLTSSEQDALLVQIELALTEPQDNVYDDDGVVTEVVNADWRLVGDFDLQATFPVN